MRNPLPGNLTGYRLNRTLHGKSVYRKADVPGHNVVRGYNNPGVGDALDPFCPAGTEVRAMHDGVITRVADPGGRLSCIYIQGFDDNHTYLTVYAHLSLKPWVRLKVRVKAGQCIGYVGRKLKDPHLHLEIWVDGHSISADTPRHLAERMEALID